MKQETTSAFLLGHVELELTHRFIRLNQHPYLDIFFLIQKKEIVEIAVKFCSAESTETRRAQDQKSIFSLTEDKRTK